MSFRRLLPVLLLVPLGVVAGHQISYAVAGAPPGTPAHGHLGLLTAAAVPPAVAGTAWMATRVRRDLIWAALALLAGVQVLAFITMEVTERLTAGVEIASLARSPWLWGAAALQVGVAVALGLTLRGAGRAAHMLLARHHRSERHSQANAAGNPPAGRPAPRPLPVTRWLLRRGPPPVLFNRP